MTDVTRPPSLTRRRMLAVGGVALAGTAVGAAPAEAATLQGRLPRRVDVVVVGAGLSGLVTARRLAAEGRSVLVLEARDRVGGRILDHVLGDGSVVESGAAFVGPTQGRLLALARELGVATFDQYVTGDNVYYADGRATRYQGTVPPDPLILPDAGLLIERINRMSREVPVDAPWRAPDADVWDRITFHEWVQDNAVNHDVQDLLLAYLQPAFGADAQEISLLHLLWFIACSGDEDHPGTFERSADTEGGAQESRFVGGAGRIPRRIARGLGDAVALDAAVRRIEQRSDRVEVTCDRGVVRADRVVVATPPLTTLGIEWDPLLPPVRRQLAQRMPMGQLMKCDAVYDEPFWRADGLTGMGVSDRGAVRVCFDNCPADVSVGVLLAFVGGSTWRKYGTQDRDARRRAVLEGLANIVGPRALHPVDYVEHDWTRERWTPGGPVAVPAPGTTTAFGAAIREPVDRVHWAGTETSTYWSGYMDGAVRAGERAAAEVLG